ncbi:Rpn family recombination-promoting nuclease/putative transposase [Aliterella atlantica]|uniref:Flagellar assembly protein H n=1 Tax=Aliterella atlantica CENA595 TaxID=1618023 RepID=A0A0D8ZTL9_9CYAN|nr:Rpn family recombination-promoting nuclease/putative transposase [Aliterella atlantica]KJH72123.1 flagellar assembly protein H [Aliterella atlantica CENA595]
MKTDSLFYRLFQEFPAIFFEIIGNTPQLADNYQFSSVEVKQTAFRIDGVFLSSQGEENPIYFVEVQFQPDRDFYARFLAEIFLYLRQNKPANNWRAVVLYPNQNADIADTKHYQEFFASERVRRIYLDRLEASADQSIGIVIVKLAIAPPTTTVELARELVSRVRQQVTNDLQQRQLVQLIETILFYKLPTMSREEIEAMFELSDLKQTKVYQEAKEEGKLEGIIEGKLESVPRLLALGLTVEQIAQAFGLNVEDVRRAAQNQATQ